MTRLLDKIKSPPGLANKAEGFVAAARLALAWERVWRGALAGQRNRWARSWRRRCSACSLNCPGPLHALLLALTAMVFGFVLSQGLRRFRWPGWEDGARRVERDSALAYRPITEGRDRLAVGADDAVAQELWRAHLSQLLSRIGRLRLAVPSPGLAAPATAMRCASWW